MTREFVQHETPIKSKSLLESHKSFAKIPNKPRPLHPSATASYSSTKASCWYVSWIYATWTTRRFYYASVIRPDEIAATSSVGDEPKTQKANHCQVSGGRQGLYTEIYGRNLSWICTHCKNRQIDLFASYIERCHKAFMNGEISASWFVLAQTNSLTLRKTASKLETITEPVCCWTFRTWFANLL